MNISKKLISYILIGFLCFSSCSITYYKSVYAFEWVEVGISTAEALKWLLGALGIAATGSAAIDNFWGGYEDEFYEYANDENVSGPDVRAWLEKLAKGTLDKSSEVWDCFRSWASSLVSENSGSSGSSFSVQDIYNYCCNYAGLNAVPITDNSTLGTPKSFICTIPKPKEAIYLQFFYEDGINFQPYGAEYLPYLNGNLVGNGSYIFQNNESSSVTLNDGISYRSFYNNSSWCLIYGNVVVPSNTNLYEVLEYNVGSSESSLDTINDARQEQFDVINRTTGDEVENEVSIPMPGVGSGDDTISQDSYDAIMDRVEAGEISLDDAIQDIQEIMQVLVYDTVTDDVIPVSPDPDDPNENQKKDDVLKEIKDNMGFSLAGLENVFPFCIPWDIYAFLNILDAEPVAPVFNIPFPNVDDPEHPLTTQVDLSSWDDAMRIVRLAQDFLFIIGLAFLTRSMIGAGGGD